MSEILGKACAEDIDETMIKIEIIYNNGQVMVHGYGSNVYQAEKNASIKGLEWLKENYQEAITKLLENSQFNQSLKACFMQHSNM